MLARMRTLLLTLALTFSLASHAQEAREAQPLDLSKVPKTGKAPAHFVPSGWKVKATTKGDLDKNGTEDVVLELVEDVPAEGQDGVPVDRAQALVALLSEKGGTLRRAGASNQVLYCTTCMGMMGGGEGGVVKIQKGVMLVDQFSGSRETRQTLLRFRYEPKDGRFVLIGQDVTDTDRLTGESTLVSTNTLNGQRVTERRKYNEKKEKDAILSSKKDKVSVKKQFLEDVNIENI
jgi:hypothetical protein